MPAVLPPGRAFATKAFDIQLYKKKQTVTLNSLQSNSENYQSEKCRRTSLHIALICQPLSSAYLYQFGCILCPRECVHLSDNSSPDSSHIKRITVAEKQPGILTPLPLVILNFNICFTIMLSPFHHKSNMIWQFFYFSH